VALAVEHARFEHLRDEEEREGFPERPASAERFFRRGEAGAWQDEMSPADAVRVERDHAKTMMRFGYL
jgi:aryl sulfotransferase